MKSLRTGVLALLALGVTGANAGGLGERGSIKDGPYAAPTFVWSGLYVGGAAAYSSGASEFHTGPLGNFLDVNLKGAQGVVAIGYDFQLSPKWVLGLFADYAFGEVKGEASGVNVAIDRQWAIGGRLGVLATPSTLLYASAGYAGADVASLVPETGEDIRRKLDGLFVGFGVEQAFSRNLSLKLDYRFSDYGNVTPSRLIPDLKFENEVHSLRLGVNYRFGN